MGPTPLAQAATETVCGPAEEAYWLCTTVYEATGNELLARAAGAANTIARVALILALAVALTWLARRLIRRFSKSMERRINERLEETRKRDLINDAETYRTRRMQRLQAITGVLQGAAGALIWITALLMIISALGVNLQPVLAGAGLLGLIVGFGAQQLVRDVLAGIAMLIEDQYGVGDWIEVDERIGQVERVGLRSTAFRDLDGIRWHVLNGYIQRVGNYSQEWGRMTFDIPVALGTDVPAAKALISKVADELVHDPVWSQDIIGPHEIWGVQDFGPEGLKIRCVIPTRPMSNWDIKRQMRERINHAFEQAGIRQPGQRIDLAGRREQGPPVRHQAVDGDRPARQRRGLVPPDATPLDAPEPAEPGSSADETTQLRMRRGSQPRPD